MNIVKQLSLLLFAVVCLVFHPVTPVSASCDPADTFYRVYVLPIFNAITKVNGVEQQFYSDFYLSYTWYVVNPCGPVYSFDNDYNPALEFINVVDQAKGTTDGSKTSFTGIPNFLSEDPNYPNPKYRNTFPPNAVFAIDNNRFGGVYATQLSMQNFPYDSQVLDIEIESSLYTNSSLEIVFYREDFRSTIHENFGPRVDIIGWNIAFDEIEIATTNQAYPSLAKGVDFDYFSRLTIRVPIKRTPDFYIYKIVLPTFLLVSMCLMLFALKADQTDRVMGTLYVNIGLITVLFVAAQFTPAVPYQTRLDKFLNFSLFMVTFFCLVGSIIYLNREEEDPEQIVNVQLPLALGEEEEEEEEGAGEGEDFHSLKQPLRRKASLGFSPSGGYKIRKSGSTIVTPKPSEVDLVTPLHQNSTKAQHPKSTQVMPLEDRESSPPTEMRELPGSVTEALDSSAAPRASPASETTTALFSSSSSSSSFASPPAPSVSLHVNTEDSVPPLQSTPLSRRTRTFNHQMVMRVSTTHGETTTEVQEVPVNSNKNGSSAAASSTNGAPATPLAASEKKRRNFFAGLPENWTCGQLLKYLYHSSVLTRKWDAILAPCFFAAYAFGTLIIFRTPAGKSS